MHKGSAKAQESLKVNSPRLSPICGERKSQRVDYKVTAENAAVQGFGRAPMPSVIFQPAMSALMCIGPGSSLEDMLASGKLEASLQTRKLDRSYSAVRSR